MEAITAELTKDTGAFMIEKRNLVWFVERTLKELFKAHVRRFFVPNVKNDNLTTVKQRRISLFTVNVVS